MFNMESDKDLFGLIKRVVRFFWVMSNELFLVIWVDKVFVVVGVIFVFG